MDDLISRAQAINEIWDGTNYDIYTREVKEILEQLPSVQPTFDARDTQYNLPVGTDLISRAQAIKAFNTDVDMLIVGGEENAKAVEHYLNGVIEKIKQLPSALSTNLAEVGTDCISRQQAIDALRTCYDTETITMDNGDEYINYGDAVGEIEQLPPIQPEPSQVARDISRIIENEKDMRIQPKKGRWILDRSGAYCCSECMEPCAGYVMMKPRDKFCKMCGAKMEVTE